jgi:hypothetical protein
LKLVKLVFLIFLFSGLFSGQAVSDEANESDSAIVESFCLETGLYTVCAMDTLLLNSVKSWQGHGDCPGIDAWITVRIPPDLYLLGGLPGQSEYYTINQTITESDTLLTEYWESLQVKPHPEFGYRPMVGRFELADTILVAIAKTVANPQYGDGGAWQIYVQHFADELVTLDTLYLKQR